MQTGTLKNIVCNIFLQLLFKACFAFLFEISIKIQHV